MKSKRNRGGLHNRGKGGKFASANRRHGVEMQKCNTPGGRTEKVPARKVASTHAADHADHARSKAQSSSERAKKVFLKRTEEPMMPFEAFGDCVRYLPSVTAIVSCISHASRYENALLEMVDQSRTFLFKFAVQYADLLKQCRQENAPGMTLRGHYADNILTTVVSRQELSIKDVQILANQVVAQAAGCPGELAVDGTPAHPTNLPLRQMNMKELEPTEIILICCMQQASMPAASSLSTYVIPKLYSGAVSEPAPSRRRRGRAPWYPLGGSGLVRTHPPPPSASAAAWIKAMEVDDAASSSTTTPSLARVPPVGDVQAMVRGTLVQLTAMADLVSSVPLASICVEYVEA